MYNALDKSDAIAEIVEFLETNVANSDLVYFYKEAFSHGYLDCEPDLNHAYYDFDELDDVLSDKKPTEIILMCFRGNISSVTDFFYVNGRGGLESANESDRDYYLGNFVRKNCLGDIAEWMLSERPTTYYDELDDIVNRWSKQLSADEDY